MKNSFDLPSENRLPKVTNLHFVFPLFSENWPMIQLLRQRFPQATFDCGGYAGFGGYRYKIGFLLKLPDLIRYSFKSLTKRCKNQPLPEFVCVGSDVEIVGCLLARWLLRKRIGIILIGFIYTPRKSVWLTRLRRLYFRLILSRIDGVVCYSKFEKEYFPTLLGLADVKFESTLFGGNFAAPKDVLIPDANEPRYWVSAGRSGRDYALLCQAVKDLPISLRIICDSEHALQGVDVPHNVTLLRSCYRKEYVRQLVNAEGVILALKDEKLSSGQMVLIDAMALGKLTIITRTVTSGEYGEHMKNCYFIRPDSVEEIQNAIEVCSKPEIRQKIGVQATNSITWINTPYGLLLMV